MASRFLLRVWDWSTCIELQSGRSKWTFDLGKPRYPLSGIALDEGSNIYVAANRHRIYKLSLDGRLIWFILNLKRKVFFLGKSISRCRKPKCFFTGGIGEDQGIILCLGYDGRLKWKRKIQGAIRGQQVSRTKICCLWYIRWPTYSFE